MSEELIINKTIENPTNINNISISNNYNEELNKFKEDQLYYAQYALGRTGVR